MYFNTFILNQNCSVNLLDIDSDIIEQLTVHTSEDK
jgi:hypothetical protein